MEYLDKWDVLAIGTIGNGAFLYSYTRNEIFTPIYQPQQYDNDKRHHYWSFCEIDAEHILAGNDIGEVEIINTKQKKSIARLEIEKGAQIRALAINQHIKSNTTKSFWVGTRLNNKGKVYSLKVKLGTEHPFSISKELAEFSAIRSIFSSEKEKGFLVGSSAGLYKVDPDGANQSIDTITTNPVSFICEDSNTNRIYFGEGQQLAYLKRGQLNSQKIALPDNVGELSYLINYGSDKVLLCTRDNFFSIGEWARQDSIVILQHFDEKKGLLYYASDTEQFPLSTIYGGILNKNIIWLSTNFGLIAFNTTNNKYDFYPKKAVGLPTLEFNTNAFLSLQSQIAVFGSLKGLVLVNMDTIQSLVSKYATALQLWKIKSVENNNYQNSDATTKTFHLNGSRFIKIEERDTIDFEDTDRDYFIVAPDYTFLQENVIQINHSKDTSFLHSNRILNPVSIFGPFEKSGKEGLFGFSIDVKDANKPSSMAIRLKQNRDKDFWMNWLVAGLGIFFLTALGAAIWNSVLSNKNKQASKQYQLRRQLFTQLGNRLSSAKQYEDIHAAFQTITKDEIEETMEATKISMYKYEREANLLRMLGHSDANSSALENNADFEQISKIKFTLDGEDNNNFPAVHFWKNRDKYKVSDEEKSIYYLLANNAEKDFYQQNKLKRPIPKRGKKTDSFIFLLIGDIENPFGILTIQNEKKRAFKEVKKVEEYLDLMSTIGQLAEFKVREIDETEQKVKERLKAAFYQSHSNFFRDRMETHFIGDIIELPRYYFPKEHENYELVNKFSKQTKKLFKELHSTNSLIELKKSVELCERYIEILNSILTITKDKAPKIVFQKEIESEEVANKETPSFIAINLLHNSIKSGILKKCDPIKIIFNAKQEKDNLVFSIRDNGKGFTKEDFQLFEEWKKDTTLMEQQANNNSVRKRSTQFLVNFFKELSSFYKEEIQLVHENLTDLEKNILGAKVSIIIPLSCIEKYNQIKL